MSKIYIVVLQNYEVLAVCDNIKLAQEFSDNYNNKKSLSGMSAEIEIHNLNTPNTKLFRCRVVEGLLVEVREVETDIRSLDTWYKSFSGDKHITITAKNVSDAVAQIEKLL